nr:MAG TPA: hypothetical protein [Caudoviricetes sp.]
MPYPKQLLIHRHSLQRLVTENMTNSHRHNVLPKY